MAPSQHHRPPHRDPIARADETYWVESRQPLASLVFIAPWLVVYEAGMFLPVTIAVRNGADAWLRQFLAWVGFGQYFLLPILTVCILLGWHYTTRKPWRFSRGLLWNMAGECALLAVCLRLLLFLQHHLWHPLAGSPRLNIAETLGATVSYLGAGIYEELLFRLILLSLAIWMLRRLKVEPRPSVVIGVLLTSLMFATAHHIGPHGDPFGSFVFLFRCLAGVFFSILFLCRGFGIAAGAHAVYDILVGLFQW
ncbi:MAG TPA: CPBP family glutamic-type intramembrane protease [Thermoguttaceae bacterium]|nr:CPBP family glutamic-type intramembrane protease [Thermoguttaceae bacterium]